MVFDFSFFPTPLKAAFLYAPVSILLSIVTLIIGLIFGTFIAITRVYKVKFLGKLSQIFVVITKGIPMILILLIVYNVFLAYFDNLAEGLHLKIRQADVDSIYIAILGLSIFATANISEAIRGALMSVGDGQYEAGYSIGLTKFQTLRRIILPQAFPVAIPMLCNSFIGLFKGSSIVLVLSVTDLFNAAMITTQANYDFFEATVAAALVYWLVCILIERLSVLLERYFSTHLRRGNY